MDSEEVKDIVEILDFNFEENFLLKGTSSHFVRDLWPLVYILYDKKIKKAYVGETTNAESRMHSHLKHKDKKELSKVKFLVSNKFNKSAALDIESKLISYMTADKSFSLLNANLGIANHNYYQKNELYLNIFKQIWNSLRSQALVKHSLEQLSNSDLFKYSPYKSLDNGQLRAVNQILDSYLDNSISTTIINGGAGTGKSIIAIYLFKLLNTNLENFVIEETEDTLQKSILEKIKKIKKDKPEISMRLVVPMSSFRKTLKKVFSKVDGLNANMVVGPSEIVDEKYDFILVDESHRLRKRVNLGAYFGSFDKASDKLKLNKYTSNELEWVKLCSKNLVLFYDSSQSIKPSDIEKEKYDLTIKEPSSKYYELYSQFRVKGGEEYSKFLQDLLFKQEASQPFKNKNYELLIFDSFEDFQNQIKIRNSEYGLSRMVAGYSWPWVSNKKPEEFDIEIENVKLRWNTTNIDWINTQNSVNEVGCIHTTQGYDLNYSGIIFGDEITYDPIKKEIIIDKDKYHDKNGKNSIKDMSILKNYILNIYKTLMLRGIKGTYIYVRDRNLREYLSRYIEKYEKKINYVKIHSEKVSLESIPYYTNNKIMGYIENTDKEYQLNNNIFAVKIDNSIENNYPQVIENNSICLFEKVSQYESLEGLLILIEIEGKSCIYEFQKINKKSFLVGFTPKRVEIEYDKSQHTIRAIFRKVLGEEKLEKKYSSEEHQQDFTPMIVADSKGKE